MTSAAGVAGVRVTLDLGSKSFKCVQCGEPDSARITRHSKVGRRAVKLTRNALIGKVDRGEGICPETRLLVQVTGRMFHNDLRTGHDNVPFIIHYLNGTATRLWANWSRWALFIQVAVPMRLPDGGRVIGTNSHLWAQQAQSMPRATSHSCSSLLGLLCHQAVINN